MQGRSAQGGAWTFPLVHRKSRVGQKTLASRIGAKDFDIWELKIKDGERLMQPKELGCNPFNF